MSADTIDKTAVKDIAAKASNLETRLYLDSSFWMSILQLALIAGATGYFIKWWALAWFVLMAATVYLRGVTKNPQVPEGTAGVIAICAGTLLHISAWAGAWIVGGAEAGFVAGVLIGSHGLFSTTLFSNANNNFYAHYGTMLAVALTTPFLIFDYPAPILLVWACMVQDIIATRNARKNRNDHLAEMLRMQSEMQLTRDASLAKSQFLATMSHELRTPLNAILGYAEILEEDLTEDGRKANPDDAVRIRRSARNLLTLINEILDFSKIEAGRVDIRIDETSICGTIDEVIQSVAHLTRAHGTEVRVDIAPDARFVATDGERLRQCLLNLMSNAAKFTEGGHINVRASIETEQDAHFLRIDVADTGCGISEFNRARLFQPFTQVDGSLTRNKDGTGLGLVITKQLCELMGGTVTVVSTEGAGSTFSLRIRDHAPRDMKITGEGPLVLVIEDEPSACDLIRRAVASLPVSIVEAHSAYAGLTMARLRTPNLIILDLNLPDRSGLDVLSELKSNPALQNAPVLIISVEDDCERAMSLGACEHLVKPVLRERIAAAVVRHALAETPKHAAA